MSKYKNAATFRAALEDRISNHSKKSGKDIPRLRRDVAFDRLLVRLFKMPSPPWALKGGYAMQLRIESARTTKDVDLALKEAALSVRSFWRRAWRIISRDLRFVRMAHNLLQIYAAENSSF